jgi:hypothetical protein
MRRVARKVPAAADAAADGSAVDRPPLGEPKPVPGMGPEVNPAAEAHISLAPDAPSAENGASVVDNAAAADQGMLHGGEGEDAEGAAEPPAQPASVTPGSSGEPAAPAPARDNFIPQDSLPEAEGQGSPATSVGALDPLEQEREAEAEQKISSAAGAGAADAPGADAGAPPPPPVGAPDAEGGAGAEASGGAAGAAAGGGLPPVMREHLAEEQQPPTRGPEEPVAGGGEQNVTGGPVEMAAADAQAPPGPGAQQVPQGRGAGGQQGSTSPFAAFLARMGWRKEG